MNRKFLIFMAVLLLPYSLFSQYSFKELDSIIDRCSLDSVLFYLEKQKELALTSDDKFTNVLNRASYYRRVDDYDSSLCFLEKVSSLASSQKRKGIVEQRKGLVYTSQLNYTKAKEHYKLALFYFSDTINKAATYFSLYDVCEDLGQPDSAWSYLLMSKRLYEGCSYKEENYGTVLNSIGIQYLRKAKYDSAYFYFLESLDIYQVYKDSYNIARTKDLIGTLFYYQSNYFEAIKYYKQSYLLFVKLRDVKSQASRLSNIGSAYKGLGSLDSAIFYFNKVYQLSTESEYTSLQSVSLSNIAIIEAESGNLNSAIDKQEQSIEIDIENNDLEGVAIGYINLGDFYTESKKKAIAIRSYKSSLELGVKINRVNIIKENYLRLSEVYSGSRDDLSLLFFKKYSSIKDSINDVEVKKNIQELNVKYNNKERELENIELKASLEKKESLLIVKNQRNELERIRRRTLYIVGLLMISALVYYFVTRNKRQKREIELINVRLERNRLEQENILERLKITQESIKQKNNIIQKFEKYLNSPEASRQLLKNLSTDKDWAKFIIDFELLYPNYFKSLPLKKGVELTKNDYRIAALSHLKLSNKEIVEVLNITLSGVKNAKSRLNSKLKQSL